MGFLVRFPEGFCPEDHGWELTASPGEGFPPVWLRWRVPYRWPESLSQCLFDEASGAVGGWYLPIEGTVPEALTVAQLHTLLREGDV